MNALNPISLLGPFAAGSVVAYWFAVVVMHLFFALAVLRDAQRQQRILHRGTFLVAPGLWFLAVAIGGVVSVAVYWLIHHSTLRPPTPPSD